MNEPLLTVAELIRKWDRIKEETGYKPVSVSKETLYRLIKTGKVRAHGFGTSLVYESEVLEDFRNSRKRNFGVIDGNPALGRKKEKVASELERLSKRSASHP